MRFEIENFTLYILDCPNSQLAKSANKLTRPLGPALEEAMGIGDIVSVNGSPTKGTAYERITSSLVASPNPMPGFVIADSPRTALGSWELDFVTSDGTQFGTVSASGFEGGPRPPGAPNAITGGAPTVTGGSGAFFGARGYFNAPSDPSAPVRKTSACEDPSVRRINAEGQGKRHGVLYLIPTTWPQVAATLDGPAVTHSVDGSLVTTAKPAKAGEILTLYATGLGPTRPGTDPGQPFPPAPLQVVNAPVHVLVNGNQLDVLYAGGYPGAVDGYQVNFRVPDGTPAGRASIQLSAAWIAGPPVSITVQ